MLKDATFKEKFSMLKLWIPIILEAIKNDVKKDHLKADLLFLRKYFPGKNLNKLSAADLAEGYAEAIASDERSEEIGEFLANRWLTEHPDVYQFFEEKLSEINPDFSAITEIDHPTSLKIIEEAIPEFGAQRTYVFSVLNSVVFSPEALNELSKRAKEENGREAEEENISKEQASLEGLRDLYEQKIARLTDKYEKKLEGMQKLYKRDTEALKKQISHLHKKAQTTK